MVLKGPKDIDFIDQINIKKATLCDFITQR